MLSIGLLRKYIQEQIARNMHTVHTDPYTFEDFEDYDININANVNGGYMLTVNYEGKKLAPISVYQDYDEAHHQARMIIDSHRVTAMQSSSK